MSPAGGIFGLLCLGLAACATGPSRGAVTVELRTHLQPAAAAWLVAAAARAELVGADPLPQHAGVPAARVTPHGYRIAAARGADGRWWLVGDGRLQARIVRTDGTPHLQADWHRCAFLPPTPPRATGVAIQLVVTAQADGNTAVTGWIDQALARRLLPHLCDSLAAAVGLQSDTEPPVATATTVLPPGCCGEHAALQAALLLQRAASAQRAGRLAEAVATIGAARALLPDATELDLQAASLLEQLGRDEQALLALGALASPPDSGTGLGAGLLAAALHARQGTGGGALLRAAAREQLARQQFDAAGSLLRRARAVSPPGQLDDLQLALQMHRRAVLSAFAGEDPALTALVAEAEPGPDRAPDPALPDPSSLPAAPALETVLPARRAAAALRRAPPPELGRSH